MHRVQGFFDFLVDCGDFVETKPVLRVLGLILFGDYYLVSAVQNNRLNYRVMLNSISTS